MLKALQELRCEYLSKLVQSNIINSFGMHLTQQYRVVNTFQN